MPLQTTVRTRLAAGAAALAALFVTLAGCGGGGGGGAPATTDGTVLIGLTDADGDFLHYTVDVVSLALERADGSTVETLPTTGRLDFAGYRDLTELFTAARVPLGTYVAGSITLDYSTADLQVESAGAAVPAIAVDRDGNALTRYTLRIQLANGRPLVVGPGIPALLSVDFDLDASHEVDLTRSPAIVTTAPFLVAELEPVDEKDLRVRGLLRAVDTAAGEYSVHVRPWHLRGGAAFGVATVHTAGDTQFEVDGVSYTGDAGLAALAALPADSPTVAFGTLTPAERRYDARIVLAGSSVPGQELDAVLGNVVARSGDVLTVRGATIVRRSGPVIFRDTVTVTIGAGTSVRRRPGQELDGTAISVGQRVEILGTITPAPVAGATTLDATAGRVRLLVTSLAGQVTTAGPGQLNVDLAAIDRRPAGLFDFSGTGIAPAVDADPADYEVATGSLPAGDLATGDVVRVFGFVQPFGAAPQDFNAVTVAGLGTRSARLALGWRPGGTGAPFLAIGADGIVPDLANPDLGARHAIVVGGVPIDLLDLPAAPALVPLAGGPTRYAILEGQRVLLFADFASLATALTERLDGSTKAYGLWAEGAWDPDGNQFTARFLGVHVAAPD
jgi:hypothetical protein